MTSFIAQFTFAANRLLQPSQHDGNIIDKHVDAVNTMITIQDEGAAFSLILF